MKKIIYDFIVSLLIFVTTTACSSKSGPAKNNDDLELEISYLNGSSISPTGDLDIVIRNVTENCVEFPVGFGVKVFLLQNEKITEVPNLVTYIGNEPITLGPRGEISATALIYFKPDVSSLIISEPIDAYITISGHLCDDESRVVEENIPFTIVP